MEIWRVWFLRLLPTPCPTLWKKQPGHWKGRPLRPTKPTSTSWTSSSLSPRPPCPLSGSGKPGKRLWVPPGLSTSYFRQQWPPPGWSISESGGHRRLHREEKRLWGQTDQTGLGPGLPALSVWAQMSPMTTPALDSSLIIRRLLPSL